MNVAVMKTKSEQTLSLQAAERIPTLPGDKDVRRAREAALAVFEAAGLPHRRIEEWKYTDLRALLKDAASVTPQRSSDVDSKLFDLTGTKAATYVFVDGRLITKPKDHTIAGVTVASFSDEVSKNPALLAIELPETVDAGARSVIALNSALASDGAVITIAAGAAPERPIHLVFIASGAVAVRNVIVAGADSESTVVETHVSPTGAARQENAVSDVTLARGATLHHVVRTEAHEGSAALAQYLVRVCAGAHYKPFQLTSGGGLSRQQLTLTFAEQHASLDFSAVALARGAGHVDTTLVVDHAVPHCTSRELFKTVLDDRARGIFQGKVIVAPNAQKTDGKQMAQALMLSPDAEFDSKPELEIYADDVVCGHGTTSAELDPDLLFYCESRGIPEVEARALLIESFVGEAVEKIENEALRDALMSYATAWLRSAA